MYRKKTDRQAFVDPAVDSACCSLFATSKLSYEFLVLETFATAFYGTTGMALVSSGWFKLGWPVLWFFCHKNRRNVARVGGQTYLVS